MFFFSHDKIPIDISRAYLLVKKKCLGISIVWVFNVSEEPGQAQKSCSLAPVIINQLYQRQRSMQHHIAIPDAQRNSLQAAACKVF